VFLNACGAIYKHGNFDYGYTGNAETVVATEFRYDVIDE